jgi:23S rRNA 5-hydroxycytidine C2501 synthase
MIAQMSKFGESKYECKHVVLKNDIDAAFIPNSVLSNVRRELIQKLDQRITDELNRSLISGMDRNFFYQRSNLSDSGIYILSPFLTPNASYQALM